MIRTVIFDAYGTLISTGTGSIDAVTKILRLNNSEIDPKEFYANWKIRHRNNIDNLRSFIPEREIFALDLEQLYKAYSLSRDPLEDVRLMLETQGRRRLYSDTLACLEKIKMRYSVGIGSTSDTEPLMRDLERGGILADYVFSSESLQIYKPCASFFSRILEEIGRSPSEVVYVGDSPYDDVYGPSLVGIKSVWLNRTDVTPHTDYIPAATIASLEALPPLLAANRFRDL